MDQVVEVSKYHFENQKLYFCKIQQTSNLSSPIGGLANGIPKKTSASDPLAALNSNPWILPYLVFTVGSPEIGPMSPQIKRTAFIFLNMRME